MLCSTREQTFLNPGHDPASPGCYDRGSAGNAVTSLGGRATTSEDAGYIRRCAEDLVKQRQLLREMWLHDADPNRLCSGEGV